MFDGSWASAMLAVLFASSPASSAQWAGLPLGGRVTANEFCGVIIRYHEPEKVPALKTLGPGTGYCVIFNEATRKLIVFGSGGEPLLKSLPPVAYDAVRKVVFEPSPLVHSSSLSFGYGPVSQTTTTKYRTFWCTLEWETAAGNISRAVLQISAEQQDGAFRLMSAAFGDRVTRYETVVGAEFDKKVLPDAKTKYEAKLRKVAPPLPAIDPTKALVIVVNPDKGGSAIKLHANGQVVAVNPGGGSSFAYLDPGEYTLVSQADNASAIARKLDAGSRVLLSAAWVPDDTAEPRARAVRSVRRAAERVVAPMKSGSGGA